MKKLTFERVGIILFCATLIGSGALTVVCNWKTIAKGAYSSVISGYKKEGISGLIDGTIAGLENGVNEAVIGRTSYINLYGLSARMLGKHYIIEASGSNSVVKDNNGHLEFIAAKVDTQPYVDKIAKLKEIYDEIGAKTLYVQTPVKPIEGYVEMPVGIHDFSNENSDNLLAQLQAAGIETLDLRENIKTSGLDYNNLFYKTDHHWKTETAFWATGEVKDHLNELFGFNLDPDDFYTDSSQYQSVFYKQNFLGSQGRRVGKYYGGVDDFTLMLPNYETDYSVTINKINNSSQAEGTFEEAIVKYNLLRPKDIFTNRYAAYFGADFPEVIVKNHKADNDLKVLIFKDSFGLPFSAFFSTMVGETRLLDTRYYSGDLEAYIREYDPDLVLYLFKSINTQA